MVMLFRISLLLLLAGMLLGDIVLASIGLIGICGGAVYTSVRQDAQEPDPVESQFTA